MTTRVYRPFPYTRVAAREGMHGAACLLFEASKDISREQIKIEKKKNPSEGPFAAGIRFLFPS